VSVALNVLFVVGILFMAYHYHVFQRIGDHIANSNSPAATLDSDEVNYLTRETLFQQLPIREHPIVFFGDSQTANCEWGELFVGVLNRGIGGDTSAGLAKRVETITKLQPKAVFLLIGPNDFARGVKPQETVDNIRATVSKIREASPATAIYVQSLDPTWKTERNRFVKQVNQMLEASFADKKSATFLDFYDSFVDGDFLNRKYSYDGLHLNGPGMMLWKKLLDPYVTPLLTSQAASDSRALASYFVDAAPRFSMAKEVA
jgi:lysophospholipase L1-like esterase